MLTPLVLINLVKLRLNAGTALAHVETLRSLCQRLSVERGRPIEPDQDLAGMPVYVERRSMTLDQTLAAVAFGFRASVVTSKSGIRITRTQDDQRKLLADLRLFWRQHLTSWFEESKRQFKAAAVFGPQYKQYNHYNEIMNRQWKALGRPDNNSVVTVTVCPMDLTPIGILYARIARGIGIDRLVEIHPYERRMWSNKPEASQRLCPNGDILLQEYTDSERSFLANVEPGRVLPDPKRFTFRQVGGTHFTLTIYDSGGAEIGRYGGPPFDFPTAGPILLSARIQARAFPGRLAEWLPLGTTAPGLIALLSARLRIRKDPVASLPPLVTNPDKSDPLDDETRVGLSGIGRHVNSDGFVVVPTDQMLGDAHECIVNGKLNITAFDHILQSPWEYERLNVNGFTVLRCRDPYRWQEYTVDSEKLAEQLRVLMSLDNIGIMAMAEAFFQLFPQGDSRVAPHILSLVVASQPHAKMELEGIDADRLAWFGAALVQCQDHRQASIDPNAEPFKSLINRGINSGWIRFTSSVPAADADLDSAVIFDSRTTSPKLAIKITKPPLISYLVGSSLEPEPEIYGLYPTQAVAESIAGTLIARYGVNYQLQPELIPNRRRIVAKFRQNYLFHLGTGSNLTVDFFATPTLRFESSLNEIRLTQSNLTFDQLPQDLQGFLVQSAVDWIQLFVQGKVGQGTVGVAHPPVRKSPPPSP